MQTQNYGVDPPESMMFPMSSFSDKAAIVVKMLGLNGVVDVVTAESRLDRSLDGVSTSRPPHGSSVAP